MNNAITIPPPNLNTNKIHDIKEKHKYNKSLQINTKDLTICNNAFKRSNLQSRSIKSLTDTITLQPLTPLDKPFALGNKMRYILHQNASSINNSLPLRKGILPHASFTDSNRLLFQKNKKLSFNRRHTIKESIPKVYKDKLVQSYAMNKFKYNLSNSNVQIALVSKRYKKKLRLNSNDKSESISRITINNNNNNKTNEARELFNSPLLTSIQVTPTNKQRLLQKSLQLNEHMRNISQTIKRKDIDIDKEMDMKKSLNKLQNLNSQSQRHSLRKKSKIRNNIEDVLKQKIINLLISMKNESKGDIREIGHTLRKDIKISEYRVKETIDDLKRLQNTNDDNLKKIVFITKAIM